MLSWLGLCRKPYWRNLKYPENLQLAEEGTHLMEEDEAGWMEGWSLLKLLAVTTYSFVAAKIYEETVNNAVIIATNNASEVPLTACLLERSLST